MFALTIKELFARKFRLLTTAFAVVIGVAFMAGTLVFTDTIGASFDSALADADKGVDAYVRSPSAIDVGYGEPGPRLDALIITAVAAVDGVDEVALRINGYAQVVDRNGEPIGDPSKSPTFGTNWVTVDDLNPYELFVGTPPRSGNEVVIDKASADKAGYSVGDTTTVLTKGEPRHVTIAGIARFGTSDSPAGATAVLFDEATAFELLSTPGEADAIAVTGDDGMSQAELASRVQAAVGQDLEVITGASLIEENQASLSSDLAAFDTMLVMFALIAVFVGAFIINNTFSIIVAQRTRDMAMLRAIGASGRQVKRSVLIESVAVGAIASAAGLVAAIGMATGLRAMMIGAGLTLPEGPMVIKLGAMTVSFLVGLVVTVLSAWLPARRAARVSPMAALRDVSIDRSAASRRRTSIGVAMGATGVASIYAGLASETTALIGVSALVLFAAVIVMGPVLVSPVARLLALPLRMRGLPGELANRNAVRNPKRTARTAASLMIGVGLVGFVTVFAASAKASISGSLDTDFLGTHIIDSGSYDNTSGLSPDLTEDLRHTPGVDVVSQSRFAPAIIDGAANEMFYAFDASTIDRIFMLGTVTGDLDSLGTDGIAVSSDYAGDHGLSIDSSVSVTFPMGDQSFTVRAIYDEGTDWVGDQFVDISALDANGMPQLDQRIYLSGDEAAISATAARYASAEVLDRQGFTDMVNSEIDLILGLFYAMLALAVIIALLGIANTLALSIVERTRELGLLRAVGMSRSQVRSTIRWESIIIAVFGTVIGLGIGTLFGWATVRALADQGIDTLSVPLPALVVVTIIAGLAGALAAVLPARRGAKLGILDALAHN